MPNANPNTPLAINPPAHFADRLLAWFDTHGRHHLPWQFHQYDRANIYAVWLSEIMLQQTQVATVLNYFEPFLAKFPTVQDLACADWDEVAKSWAGLGYYARARNLHAGAKQLDDFIKTHSDFPQTLADWQAIKGVGASTAGAIMAMGVRDFGVICDGNVKRVLTRHQAIDADITKKDTDQAIWRLAHELTPTKNSGRYAQAMMDLGATICTRTKPKCDLCPVSQDCQARQQGKQTAYPVKSKATPKPHRHSLVVILRHQNQTLWLKRHSTDKANGIWEGLWCLPLATSSIDQSSAIATPAMLIPSLVAPQHAQIGELQVLTLVADYLNTTDKTKLAFLTPVKHTLTHLHWHLYPVIITIDEQTFTQINHALAQVQTPFKWCEQTAHLAIPTAMQKVLNTLK